MTRPHAALLPLVTGRAVPQVAAADAASLVESALEHRVSGLLWTAVQGGSVTLPAAQLADLARHDLAAQSHNRMLWRALDDVTARLRSIGVSVASAKGVTAEARWYDRVGQRPCRDIDLLLAPDDLSRITEVVEALEPTHSLLRDVRQLVTSGVLQSLDLTVGQLEIDLHVDLLKVEVPTRRPDLVWSAREDVTGPEGVQISAMNAEMSLIHFLVHLNKDRFARLLGYVDVARILTRSDLDWGFIDDFLRGEGLQTQAYCALDAVVSDLDLQVADLPRPSPRAAAVWRHFWPAEDRMQGHAGLVAKAHRQLWLPWLAHGRTLEALRWWLRRRAFPPRALVSIYHWDTRGPYLWRLARGRIRRAGERRRIERGVAAGMPQLALLAGERYKTFPPKWSHIRVPTRSQGSALAAIALYAPCQPGGYAVRDAAWAAVRTLGPRVLPSRAEPFLPPMSQQTWQQMLSAWQRDLGTFTSLAVITRPQAGRTGFSVLLINDDTGVAFVRVHPGTVAHFDAERRALELCAAGPVGFWHPTPLGTGAAGEWAYLATTALGPQRHRAITTPPHLVLEEISRVLRPLPRGDDIPPHWIPMHGDFTHWNCRTLQQGRIAVFDWEDVGWGPPGADEVLLRATAAALGQPIPGESSREAATFWIKRMSLRAHDKPDERLAVATLAALRQMLSEEPAPAR